jgi:hypothetical protein
MTTPFRRPKFRVIEGDLDRIEWSWFCGHCGAVLPDGGPPAPHQRVCRSCGMGVLLEARADAVPEPDTAFLVIDSRLLVQAVSKQAEAFLGLDEEAAINRPVAELLVPADAEARGPEGFAAMITRAAASDDSPTRSFVRPANTFGVRIRARISACGPPRAALVVLEGPGATRPKLRAV